MTTAYTIFTKAVIRQGKLLFEITVNNVPNKKTLAGINDVEAGKT